VLKGTSGVDDEFFLSIDKMVVINLITHAEYNHWRP
jgi:hypothetical protein